MHHAAVGSATAEEDGIVSQDERSVENLVDDYLARRLDRRAFFKRAGALGVSASAAATILAACGGGNSGTSSSSAAETTLLRRRRTAAAETTAAESTTAAAETTAAESTTAPAETAAIKKGGQLVEGYDRDFAKIDPVLTTWDDPSFVAIYEFPMIRDADGAYAPSLFESWEVSPDLLTWTFKLRPNLAFQSGAPLDAKMVAENFNIFRDPEKGQNAIFWPSVKDVTSTDATTVVVTMNNPFTAFPETLATENSMPVNLREREKLGDNFGVTGGDGTGPFTFGTYTPGTEVVVNRWDAYPGSGVPYVQNPGPAYLDSVRWVPILEVGNRANEIETGSVDGREEPGAAGHRPAEGQPRPRHDRVPGAGQLLDIAEPRAARSSGFDDLRVRQAISHAIDREGLAQSLYFGHAAATYGPFPPNYKWYDKGVEAFNQFDTEKAKALLDEAGWTEGSGGIREKGGKKLSWEHINDGGQPTTKAIDEAVVAMLKDVGIDMKVKSLDAAAWGESVIDAKNPPASWGFEWLWSSPVDLLVFFHAYPSDAYNGAIPEIKAAVKAWQSAKDFDEMAAAAKQFQLAWAEKLPKISLLTTDNVWVADKKVMGYTPLQSMLYPLYNDVWIDA